MLEPSFRFGVFWSGITSFDFHKETIKQLFVWLNSHFESVLQLANQKHFFRTPCFMLFHFWGNLVNMVQHYSSAADKWSIYMSIKPRLPLGSLLEIIIVSQLTGKRCYRRRHSLEQLSSHHIRIDWLGWNKTVRCLFFMSLRRGYYRKPMSVSKLNHHSKRK